MTSPNLTDPRYLQVIQEFDAFCDKVDEEMCKKQKQLKACKEIKELENKLGQELKIKNELTQQLSDLSRRGGELGRVCAAFEARLTIADSDQHRLDNAKENYQLGKELTGIRFDYSAPANTAKGYIKNESRKLLLPFEMQADSEALWQFVRTACDPSWPDKENHNIN